MSLCHDFRRGLFGISAGVCCFLFCHGAFADDACLSLGSNEDWNKGMNKLSAQMTEKKWDDALKTAEKLNATCDRSPILNYAMGRIYKEKGDNQKFLFHMRRATLSTEEFAVKGKNLEQMWFDRYEAEHPDARPETIASRQKELELRQQEVEDLRLENTRLKGEIGEASLAGRLSSFQDTEAERRHYAAGLWTGVAAAGVGLALVGAGAGLWATSKDDTVGFDEDKEKKIIKPYTKLQNNAYWGMIGGGIASTVLGAALAGIFGYWYAQSKQTDETVSFYSTSNGMGIQF